MVFGDRVLAVNFMIRNIPSVGEMIAGGLREATQGPSDSARSSIIGHVLSLLSSILKQPVVVRPVVAQQCSNCLVIMPVSDNGSCIFTFPPTHSFFHPSLTAVWTFLKFFRNWRSGLLAAGRTVIQLLGSETPLGIGRRLQRSNELGGE